MLKLTVCRRSRVSCKPSSIINRLERNSPPKSLQLIRRLTLGDGLPTRQPPLQPTKVPHERNSIPQMRLTESLDLDFILDTLQVGNDASAACVDFGDPDSEGEGEVGLVGENDALLVRGDGS